MERSIGMRGVMALIGGLAGGSVYLLYRLIDAGNLSQTVSLALVAFAASFLTGLMAMAGPLSLRRAATGALVVSVVATGLLMLARLRFVEVEDIAENGFVPLFFVVTALIPLPFWIAANGAGWRDYPTLFLQAWGIVVRYSTAWLFAGVVWALIFLSDALLGIVGLNLIDDVIELPGMAMVICGVTLGLAIAVVNELSDYVSPFLVLRLLRLLLPVVLVVMVVFIVALPVQGMSGLFGGLSVAATLLGMCMAAATLVTTAIDQRDEDAVKMPAMVVASKALAVILPVPAALAVWSIWMRVAEYGWTPARVFAGLGAGMALAYGLVYLLAVLRGVAWKQRIRQGNVMLALLLVGLAALSQTPLFNAEAISARSQYARVVAGQAEGVTLRDFDDWGRPGVRAVADLEAQAEEPGQEALAAWLASDTVASAGRSASVADLAAVMPVRPEAETAVRDRLLAGFSSDDRGYWLAECERRLPDGRPGCVLVVGRFWQDREGPQALLVTDSGYGPGFVGMTMEGSRSLQQGAQVFGDVFGLDGAAAVAQLLDAAPVFGPVPLNQIDILGRGVTLQR